MALVLSGSIDISGSMTATTILVSSPGAAGMVSSSAQITELAPLMAYTASLKGAAIVSSSQQITNYYKFAETASANTFYGNQTISGSLLVSGSLTGTTADFETSTGLRYLQIRDAGTSTPSLRSVNNTIAQLRHIAIEANTISLRTGASSGLSVTEALSISATGDVTVSTGNLVMASGKGIDFSATANGAGLSTDSELFNDYEEGRWTPVISDGTNNATMDATYNRGQYIKVGRQVTVTGYVIISSLGSVSGEIRITGLPYVNGGGYGYIAAMIVGTGSSLNITAGYNVTGTVPSSQSYIGLNIWDSAAGTTGLTGAEFSSDGQLQISCTYLTDY